jgi:uncharacterized protein (DUF1015 family)
VAQIRPFPGIRYGRPFKDLSNLIAPPYDVLNEAQRAALQARHPNNIVTVDLPWMPPKSVGPDGAYEKAKLTFDAWLSGGILQQDKRRALYPYTQSFEHAGKTFHRRGFICLVKLTPFGQDVIPHERTYAGPIEDRMKLMRATGMQLSPIFGLFNDPRGQVTERLYRNVGKPECVGTMDGVRNDLWSIIDAEVENEIIDLMRARPIYIADGHHRYTTALQYQKEVMKQENHGKPLPPAHPANWCMFVLVGMQDDGLLILPTHRLIGGTEGFDIQIFKAAVKDVMDVTESPLRPEQFNDPAQIDPGTSGQTFGLYDGLTKKFYTLRLRNRDILKQYEPDKSVAWQQLDVAILQRYLLDEVLQPEFASPKELVKGYTADANSIVREVDGGKYQLALMLRPTPLSALEDLGKHGDVMPQKSTYFYPKLATGMVINPLR